MARSKALDRNRQALQLDGDGDRPMGAGDKRNGWRVLLRLALLREQFHHDTGGAASKATTAHVSTASLPSLRREPWLVTPAISTNGVVASCAASGGQG